MACVEAGTQSRNARSTYSAGRVHSKLVEHCSVTLEGVCSSKQMAFKLCSPAIVDIIMHRCPYMVRSSNTYTVRVYVPQRRFCLNVLPPLGFDRTVDSTVNHFFPSVFCWDIF